MAESPFHIVAKPVGPRCNMNCEYCFYSEKEAMYPDALRMSDSVLERFISEYILSSPSRQVSFLWQGGEPLMAGISFYEKVLALQEKYRGSRQVSNSIQTNGTLLNPKWCRFLKQNRFLVGISLDGPEEVHDAYRSMKNGGSSHADVVHGIRLLQKYRVDYNVTCCVSDRSAEDPLAVYHYFKKIGVQYIQFAPIVERLPDDSERKSGYRHGGPGTSSLGLAPGTVEAAAYGRFLTAVFDEWVREDIGEIFVMNYEWALAAWLGLPASYCFFAESCGNAFAAEENGDIYVCDHFVYPEYRMGSLAEQPMTELLRAPARVEFTGKKSDLPDSCRSCPYLFACNGECPKNRFLPGGGNYLCAGYRLYFSHIAPYMEVLANRYRSGRPLGKIRRKL